MTAQQTLLIICHWTRTDLTTVYVLQLNVTLETKCGDSRSAVDHRSDGCLMVRDIVHPLWPQDRHSFLKTNDLQAVLPSVRQCEGDTRGRRGREGRRRRRGDGFSVGIVMTHFDFLNGFGRGPS